jgi:hypothetical protein
MPNKSLLFALLLCLIGCDSHTLSQSKDKRVETNAIPLMLPCDAVLKNKNADDLQKIYSDTMFYSSNVLLIVTRDSTLSLYRQNETACTLLLKQPIDSTDLYSYRDGSPLFLEDLDGDKQKEILVTVGKNGGNSRFRVYRLMNEKGEISIKKIRRFEKIINPQYDATTHMVRSHWYERKDYEVDEYYQIKDNALVFVKGFESKNGKESRYFTKED